MRIGIDIGGTKIAAGLVNQSGQVVRHKKVKTDAHNGYPSVRDKIHRLVRDLFSLAAISGLPVAAGLCVDAERSGGGRTGEEIALAVVEADD